MVLKRGDKGTAVGKLQSLLGIAVDNKFGSDTEVALRSYQKANGLDPDGVCGSQTAEKLGFRIEDYISTDLKTSSSSPSKTLPAAVSSYQTSQGLTIFKSYLDNDEYVAGKKGVDKEWLVLHHTAGGHNPFATISQWNNDTRGRIATQFVIGGISTTNGDATHDGSVVECFPDADWAYHLGENGSSALHPQSIGIEICNWGYLEERDGKFFNYVNKEVPASMVCDLGYKFCGKQYYHKYTTKQIDSLIKLIFEIERRHPKINMRSGLVDWLRTEHPSKVFSFRPEAYKGQVKGILSHTNIRSDKSDVFPQPELVSALKNL